MYDINFTKTFNDYGLPSVDDFSELERVEEPLVLGRAASLVAAHKQIADILMGSRQRIEIQTPAGQIIVDRDRLWHIVEKPESGREQFANFIRPTLEEPTEIWLQYDPVKGVYRRRFIKLFKTYDDKKRNFFVATRESSDGSLLWTAFPAQAGYIDKQRTGVLLYSGVRIGQRATDG